MTLDDLQRGDTGPLELHPHLGEGESERLQRLDALETLHVGRGLDPRFTGTVVTRNEQSELVLAVQGAHRDARTAGEISDLQS